MAGPIKNELAEGQQCKWVDGLHQVFIRPLLDEFHRQLDGGGTGDDDDRGKGLVPLDAAHDIGGVAIRELVVKQDHIGLEPVHGLAGQGHGGDALDPVGLTGEDLGQQVRLNQLVLDDQDLMTVHPAPHLLLSRRSEMSSPLKSVLAPKLSRCAKKES